MTELRKLKKELAKWKKLKSDLPRLIDCSKIYGDGYYSLSDMIYADRKIKEIEEKLSLTISTQTPN